MDKQKAEKLNKGFEVSSVCRADLVSQGYDEAQVLALTDDDMRHIASKMGEGFTEYGGYWDALDTIARDDYKLKRFDN